MSRETSVAIYFWVDVATGFALSIEGQPIAAAIFVAAASIVATLNCIAREAA